MWTECDVAAEFEQALPWERVEQYMYQRRKVRSRQERERRKTKRNEQAPCPGCGKRFDNRPRGWLRKFCTDACRRRHNNTSEEYRRKNRERMRCART